MGGTPPLGGVDIISSLRAGVRARARSTANPDKVGTALEWLYHFVRV